MCKADLCVVLEIKFLISSSRSPMTTCVSSSLGWLKRSPPVVFTRRRSFSSFFVGRPHRYSYRTNVNKQLLEENSTFHDVDFSFTDLAAIQYIIPWAHSKVKTINGIGNLETADCAVRESGVVDCHAGVNRDVAQAQKRRTFEECKFFVIIIAN